MGATEMVFAILVGCIEILVLMSETNVAVGSHLVYLALKKESLGVAFRGGMGKSSSPDGKSMVA